MTEMTPEDYKSVTAAGQLLQEQGWRKVFTVNEMMEAWESLVAEVETGYDQLVDEYTNDLACRDWLALAWPHLTERVQAARRGALASLDARFTAATTEDTDQRLSRFHRVDAGDGWWWRRLPAQRLGAFANDMND
ncbi:hypothetical protein [Nocardioides plantarum]|uniref:Uncharacterized protein n=1 Tax=Nocardioides plantarum TaxID=29299 RepID=A0ABV5K8G4_9ACTN|nr:hypothetical protein [Nocardioides plantarum]